MNNNKNPKLGLLIKIIGVIVGLYLLFNAFNIVSDNASYNAGYNNAYNSRY